MSDETLSNLLHEKRRFEPAGRPRRERQRQGRRLRRGRRRTGSRSGRRRPSGSPGTTPWDRGPRLGQPAVRQVVRRRQAQRGVQLRRPARRGRQRRPGRLPLGRRAGGRHPRHHLRRAQGHGLPGGQRADRPRRQDRRPGRDLHADDPRDRGRDAGLRAASAPRTPWSSAASPSTALRDRIQDCDARVVITADGGYRRGAAGRPEAGGRRGARAVPRRPQRARRTRTGQDVAWTEGRDVWWHDAVGRRVDRAHARGVRRRAPALRHVHLRHDRQAQGHPAHHRRLPRRHVVHALGGLRPQARRPTSSGPRPTSAGSPATPTSSTGRSRTAPRR